MDIRTYRASSMQEALELVQRELGPDAAILHAREVRRTRFFGLLRGPSQIEVTASCGVNVPSRLPAAIDSTTLVAEKKRSSSGPATSSWGTSKVSYLPKELAGKLNDVHGMLQELCRRSRLGQAQELPDSLFHLFTDLIEADVDEDLARELLERVRADTNGPEVLDAIMVRGRICRLLEAEIATTGPIKTGEGFRRLVALVGPTGVGKTTTIAKLAAHYRLREKRNVGLITVDTYRIAAVEQLRTYADIMDLPMHVVATPREMRETIRRLEHIDLILMDTAGRSPKDEVKLQELKSFLTEARADEVHLVLSATGSMKTLQQTAEHFSVVGTTALILTKLDEASTLGHLVPVIRAARLPLSYLTTGQNVPDDIEVAESGRLVRLLLGWEPVRKR